MTYSNRESVTFRTSLIGLSVHLHKAIVIIYSRGVVQPSAIRHQEVWDGSEPAVSTSACPGQWRTIELLGNALTFKRFLQRPAPSHLWTTDQPRMRYPTFQQLPSSTMMSRATLGKRDSAMYSVTAAHWPWVRHQNSPVISALGFGIWG